MEQVSITIPCGLSFQTASVPKEKIAGMITSNEPLNGLSEEEIIRQALANPIDSESLSSLSRTAKRVLLISPDHTRPMPSRMTIPLLLEEIRKEAVEKNILISTHAIAMKGALEYLTPDSCGSYWSKYIGNCAVYTAEITPEGGGSVPVPWECI